MRTLPLLAGLLLLAACASSSSPVVGGTDYAPQYDFSEFYAATNDKTFRVVVAGNPFPQIAPQEMQQRLLPVMQANRPRPRLTFTYAVPAELPRPDYRLVLVFDAANDLTAARVCAGEIRLKPHASRARGPPLGVRQFTAATIRCCRRRPPRRPPRHRRTRGSGSCSRSSSWCCSAIRRYPPLALPVLRAHAPMTGAISLGTL